MKKEEFMNQLAHFTGSEVLYFNQLFRKVQYTEGVKFFAEHAGGGAYWLLDILLTEPGILKQAEDFAAITVRVAEGSAVIEVTDGNKNLAWKREIDFTTLWDGEYQFFMTDDVLMLVGEY